MLHQQLAAVGPWLAIAVLVIHVTTLIYAWLRRSKETEVPPRGTGETIEGTVPTPQHENRSTNKAYPEQDLVRCRACGTENEMGYRFCRGCVTELPGSAGIEPGAPQAPGRFIR